MTQEQKGHQKLKKQLAESSQMGVELDDATSLFADTDDKSKPSGNHDNLALSAWQSDGDVARHKIDWPGQTWPGTATQTLAISPASLT